MTITLNYTSKGLIDAIQRQLQQQQAEGKIKGDISYKKIVTCDFWSTLKKINDSHDKGNKIYHQKSYSCNDRGKPVDWKKTVVVYGTANLSDDEWARLVGAMELEITTEVPKAKDSAVKEDETVTDNTKKTEEDDDKGLPIGTMSIFITELEKHNLQEPSATVAQKILNSGYKVSFQNEKLIIKDKQNNPISITQVLEVIKVTDMKNNSVNE